MEKINLDQFDYKRNLLFIWPPWVWKTFEAKRLLNNYVNETTHEKLRIYEITDWYFKQLVKSKQLILRWPEDYWCNITLYPLEMMTRVDVLLYDDLWVNETTEAYLKVLLFVLDERIKKNKINIITSNLTSKELKTKLNEMIYSRLLLNTNIVIFEWEDKRLNTTKYFKF